MKFANILEDWWAGNKIGLRIKTIHNKRMAIDVHILPFFGDLDIKSIDDNIINKFITQEIEHGNRLTGEGICRNSVLKNLGIVQAVMNYAFEKGYISQNPFALIKKMSKEEVPEYEIFTPDEVKRLIAVARPYWLGDMIELVYRTGLRKCECYGLQWEDINFDQKYLRVNRSVTSTKPGDRIIDAPKTRSSKRVVLLDDKTLDMFMRRFINKKSDIWVFADKNGKLLSPWYHVKYFSITRKKAGISPQKRFYDLRHTHITELVLSNVPLPVIQQRVGHSNIQMTMHYTHIQSTAQNYVIDILNSRNI